MSPNGPSPAPRPLRVAVIGCRGVPARYGGYETFVEELGRRLAARGIEVTVYCRSHYTDRGLDSHLGMKLVVLPTLRTKYFDTPVHTLLSVLHAGGRGYDVALVVNAVNSIFVPGLRVRGVPVALNVDGIEKRRAKWGWPGRVVYAVSERLATRVASELVTDADVIAEHYRLKYHADSTTIVYGVDPEPVAPGTTLQDLGLDAGRYFLYVSRFERENNPHRVTEAYREVAGDTPLVMVGGAPYANKFVRGFTEKADPRVHFPGPIYGEGYRELLSNCAAYIQATEVGGTHPALVEAMGYGCCVVVNDTPENREVAADAGRYFDVRDSASLARVLEGVLSDRGAAAADGERAAARAREHYDWNAVADEYEALLRRLARHG